MARKIRVPMLAWLRDAPTTATALGSKSGRSDAVVATRSRKALRSTLEILASYAERIRSVSQTSG